MDFHRLGRRDLQVLCKKNRIPANMTNVAMADALTALETVEGVEDIQLPIENENSQLPAKTPGKALPQTPDVSKSCRRSTRKNPVPSTEDNVQATSQATTRTRRGTATKVSGTASRRRILKELDDQEENSKESEKPHLSQEIVEEDKESEMPETPVSRNVGRRRVAASSVRGNAESKAKRKDTPAVVELSARTGTRRSTRLGGSEKKLFEELPSTRKSRGKKETVEFSDALVEEPEIKEQTPEETLDKSKNIDSFELLKISEEPEIIEETHEETLDESEIIVSIGIASESHSIEQPFEKYETIENDQQGLVELVSSDDVTDDQGVFSVKIASEAHAALSETYIMPENSLDQAEEKFLPELTNGELETEIKVEDVLLPSEAADDLPSMVQNSSLSMECESLTETVGAENEKPIANQPEELTLDASPALKSEENIPECEEGNLDLEQENKVTSFEVLNETESYTETSMLEVLIGEPDDAASLLIREDGPEPADMTSEIDEWNDDAHEDDSSSTISSLADVDIAEYEAEAGLEDSVFNNSETNLFVGEVTVDVLNKGDEGTEHQPLPVEIPLLNQKISASEETEKQNPDETQNIASEGRVDSVYTYFARDLAEALTPLRVVPTSSTACSRIQVISPPREAITPNSGSLLRKISSGKKATPIKSNGKKKALEPDNKENNSEQSITREPIKLEKMGKVKQNKKVLGSLDGKSMRQLKRMVKEAAEVGKKSAALQPLTENCLSARNN